MSVAPSTTIYTHYTQPVIHSGLTTINASHFTLNNLPLTIYSGALHYFRVPKAYWRDRLRKLKAAGLNTVETYVPWNLHEPSPGYYDFGSGGTDFEQFLDIAEFLKLAQEEDLLAIVRPGPYICSEWDFGGLPSWLLKDPNVIVRRNNAKFLEYVGNYFNALFKILAMLQFTKGGPIVAFQVENEYGNVKVEGEDIDQVYLKKLVDMFKENGVVELLFTSDTPSNGDQGAIPGLLNTANFQTDAVKELNILRGIQKDKPLMVMEFWSGWFDHWGEKHHTVPTDQFAKELEDILSFPASVNFYMFHGGTNWGFLNGANIMEKDNNHVAFDTSSYDYDCPLSESGDYTEKYHALKRLIAKYNTINIKLPEMPAESKKIKYSSIPTKKMLKLSNYIKLFDIEVKHSHKLQTMEYFDQQYGYIVYSKTICTLSSGAVLKLSEKVKDTVLVLVNGKLVNKPFEKPSDVAGFGYWKAENSTIVLTNETLTNARLDLIVENFGRVNYGKLHDFNQFRGLSGNIYIDNVEIFDWEVVSLPFSKKLNNLLSTRAGWEDIDNDYVGPALYTFNLNINNTDTSDANLFGDSFIDMSKWNKGIVIVNGFVLSRYFKLGPQQTCYIPGPLLKPGCNEIIVFEHFEHAANLEFNEKPIFYTMQ
ncbi:beta-galactosidase-1-like protein 2 [Atheta coriaria]|uniref:beta-galactosidase-1-like protein 2 n=1 Tax=Dalotia coriaria TaxID=877792 RepID=UPI0031F3618E